MFIITINIVSAPNIHVLSCLIGIQQQMSLLMPIASSLIAQEILLCILKYHFNGKALSVKQLFASLPYSTMGIRYHFNKLIEKGWIDLKNGDKDKRLKHIIPCDQLLYRFDELCRRLINNKMIGSDLSV
jgi:hypothetical protein